MNLSPSSSVPTPAAAASAAPLLKRRITPPKQCSTSTRARDALYLRICCIMPGSPRPACPPPPALALTPAPLTASVVSVVRRI